MPRTLSPAARELLHVLQFRHDLGQAWAVAAARGRVALVVPQMHAPSSPARLQTFDGATLYELDHAGLITVGSYEEPPAYVGRHHNDRGRARRVTLLAAGSATCPTCCAIGSEPCRTSTGRVIDRRHPKRPAEPEGVRP